MNKREVILKMLSKTPIRKAPYWLLGEGRVLILDEDRRGDNTLAYIFKPACWLGTWLRRTGWAMYTHKGGWQYLFKE